ncbi:MAG: alpha/beta hydrolase [Synergistaceae bacterium]|nr:alpha/beta hydrolase [Synergistaceae bacterium]
MTRSETARGAASETLNGIRVNCYDRAEDARSAEDAVLFLHGWGSDFSPFRPFLDGMSGRRVCALNLPGFGGSAEPPVAWSVGDYADFVLDFLAERGIRSVTLIGHSFGGRISIKLAARGAETRGLPVETAPVEIVKMVLVDSAGIRPKRTPVRKLKTLAYKGIRGILSLEAVRKRAPSLLESWRMRNASADYRNATPRMRECLAKAVGEDLTPCLSAIRCPTLLIWGENDSETPLSDARIMERLIPDAGLVVLKNAGHYSFLDQSYAFGRVLDSFLNIAR